MLAGDTCGKTPGAETGRVRSCGIAFGSEELLALFFQGSDTGCDTEYLSHETNNEFFFGFFVFPDSESKSTTKIYVLLSNERIQNPSSFFCLEHLVCRL